MSYQFKTTPWQHQIEALKLSWDKKYFALLMEYGTGKTFVIINNVAVLYEKKKIDALVVVAPNEVHTQWVDEQIPEHMPDRIAYIARSWENKTSKKYWRTLENFWAEKNKKKLKIFTVNVETLQAGNKGKKFLKRFLTDFTTFFVVDESTRIKSSSSARFKYLMKELYPLTEYRRTLTGNEITRAPFDVYAPYTFLYKHFWAPITNYHHFTRRYGEYKTGFVHRKEVKVNGKCTRCEGVYSALAVKRLSGKLYIICPNCLGVIDNPPPKARKVIENKGRFEYPILIKYKNLEQLRAKTATCSYVVKKEDCMDIPTKVYQPLYCKMNKEQRDLYVSLREDLIMEYKDHEIEVENKLALSVRFQQIVGGYFPETEEQIGEENVKLERLLYDLEDIDCPDPIIIWAVFVPELKAIAKRLSREYPNKKLALYYGGVSTDERRVLMQRFKAGDIDYFVANPATAGTGLNLQRAYIHYYFSNSFKAEDRWQSEDRSHRGLQKHTCLYKDIFIRGTIDDSLQASNRMKVDFANFFKDKAIGEII